MTAICIRVKADGSIRFLAVYEDPSEQGEVSCTGVGGVGNPLVALVGWQRPAKSASRGT